MRTPEVTSIPVYMNLVAESGAQIVRQLTYADLLWKQIELNDNQWNFVYSDSVFMDFPDPDYVANLYDIKVSEDSYGYRVPWRICDDPLNPDCRWGAQRDSNDTKEYLDTVIQRYRNIIKYWEIGNEVENGRAPTGFQPAQLVEFLAYNYRWIKSIEPNAKVILPSFVGTYGVPYPSKYEWLRNIFSLRGGNYIDIIGYHDYNSWWTLPLHIDSLMAVRKSFGLESKPFWLTESSVSSNSNAMSSITPAYSSIDEQAADVWRRSSLAWSKGVEVYFWHSMWSSGPPSEWQEFGLVNNIGKKKKSFHSYKLLAEKIVNFSSVELISSGIATDNNDNGGNGTWVVKFIVDGKNYWVMWSPDNQQYTLNSLNSTHMKITEVVPGFISVDGETATYDETTSPVVNNSYTIALNSLPVLVEETNLVSVDEKLLPYQFSLEQNYPNPFNPTTTIEYTIHTPTFGVPSREGNQRGVFITLKVYDILGREVATLVDGFKQAGKYNSQFSILNSLLSSGVYFYTLRVTPSTNSGQEFVETKKMVLLK